MANRIEILKPTHFVFTIPGCVVLNFAVLGDVHENIDSFQEAIKDLNTINPHMDALVLNGDTVDQGIEEQYDSIKKLLVIIRIYYLKQLSKI